MTRSVMTASAGHQATVTDSPRPVSIRPDHYPTRSSAAVDGNGRVRWVDRNQPTVWTDAVQMHDHDLEHYRRAGYVTNEALLSGSEVERRSEERRVGKEGRTRRWAGRIEIDVNDMSQMRVCRRTNANTR